MRAVGARLILRGLRSPQPGSGGCSLTRENGGRDAAGPGSRSGTAERIWNFNAGSFKARTPSYPREMPVTRLAPAPNFKADGVNDSTPDRFWEVRV